MGRLTTQSARLLRQAGRWCYGAYAWCLFGVVVLLFGGLIVALRKPAYGRPLARMAARTACRCAGISIRITGADRLPDQPHILLVNHTSFLDAIVLTALLPARPGYAFAARQQYRSQGLLCPLLHALGTVVLQPGAASHHRSNIRLFTRALGRGERLVIFPEGGISPEAGLKPFHSGAFIAASAQGVPLVVAALRGAREDLRLGTWMPRPAPIDLVIGPVLQPAGKDVESAKLLAEAAHEAMLPLTGERDAGQSPPL